MCEWQAMRPAVSSGSVSSAASLLAMFAKEAFSLSWLRAPLRGSPGSSLKEPVKSLIKGDAYAMLTPSSSTDACIASSSMRRNLSRGLTGSLLDAISGNASDFSRHKGTKTSGIAVASREAVGQEKLTPSVEYLDDIEKITASLAKKYPDKVVGDTALDNIKSMMQLGASRARIVRLFSANSTFYDKQHNTAIQSKSEVLGRFGLDSSVLLKALGKSTDWLEAPDSEAAQVLEYLDKDLGVNNLGKLVSANPHALGLQVNEVKEAVRYLQNLEFADTGSAVDRNPSLLGKMGKDGIDGKIKVLENILGLDKGQIRLLADKQSALISCDSEAITETHGGLIKAFGKNEVANVLAVHPQLLTISFQKLSEPIDGLMSVFTKDETLAMVKACPLLLRRKWDHQKFIFLTEEMKRSKEELLAWPAALTFSLKDRLELRQEVLLKQGAGKQFTLRSMFGCSNATFERRFNVELPQKKRGTEKSDLKLPIHGQA